MILCHPFSAFGQVPPTNLAANNPAAPAPQDPYHMDLTPADPAAAQYYSNYMYQPTSFQRYINTTTYPTIHAAQSHNSHAVINGAASNPDPTNAEVSASSLNVNTAYCKFFLFQNSNPLLYNGSYIHIC
jgi:hypothetical protein